MFNKIFRYIYAFWCLFWFVTVFMLIFPFFVLFIQNEKWHAKGHFLNKLWAYTVFGACFLPTRVEFQFKRKKGQPYVYCPNHTSYLDIPSLCYALPGYFMFVGKASLTKVPLFGYMFKNLYIPVDRHRLKDRYNTMVKALEAVDKGRSLAIFPEGTIPKGNHPTMIPFKDGPFRIAVEKQIPIVPVTISYNWIILPDNGMFIPNRRLMKTVIHEPIETKGMTVDDIEYLKRLTFETIDNQLKADNHLNESR